MSPAISVRLLVKRASALTTVTPSAANRSTESVGAIPAMTPLTCRITALKSISGSTLAMPNFSPVRIASACFAAAISALEGTQP